MIVQSQQTRRGRRGDPVMMPAQTGGGGTDLILLKNVTRQGQVAAVAAPASLTPSSTNTSTDTVTFGGSHGWVTGTRWTCVTTQGGLTSGTRYYLSCPSGTTIKFHLTVQDARDA